MPSISQATHTQYTTAIYHSNRSRQVSTVAAAAADAAAAAIPVCVGDARAAGIAATTTSDLTRDCKATMRPLSYHSYPLKPSNIRIFVSEAAGCERHWLAAHGVYARSRLSAPRSGSSDMRTGLTPGRESPAPCPGAARCGPGPKPRESQGRPNPGSARRSATRIIIVLVVAGHGCADGSR